jgi:hypothetical protein
MLDVDAFCVSGLGNLHRVQDTTHCNAGRRGEQRACWSVETNPHIPNTMTSASGGLSCAAVLGDKCTGCNARFIDDGAQKAQQSTSSARDQKSECRVICRRRRRRRGQAFQQACTAGPIFMDMLCRAGLRDPNLSAAAHAHGAHTSLPCAPEVTSYIRLRSATTHFNERGTTKPLSVRYAPARVPGLATQRAELAKLGLRVST